MKITLTPDMVLRILSTWAWQQPGVRDLFPGLGAGYTNRATLLKGGGCEIEWSDPKSEKETPT